MRHRFQHQRCLASKEVAKVGHPKGVPYNGDGAVGENRALQIVGALIDAGCPAANGVQRVAILDALHTRRRASEQQFADES